MAQISTTGTGQQRATGTFNAAGTAVTVAGLDAGSGSFRGLVVFVSWLSSPGHSIASVDFGGVALTAKAASTVNFVRQQTFFLLNPTGTGTLTVDPSTGVSDAGVVIDIYFLQDAVQDDTQWTLTTATGTDSAGNLDSLLTATTAVGDLLLVSHGIRQSGTMTSATPQDFTGSGTFAASLSIAQMGGYLVADATTELTTTRWVGGFAIDYNVHGLAIPNAGASTGFVLDPESGTTNGSGVLTTTATSDDAMTANGEVRLITATVNGIVVARLTHRPS